MAVHCIYQLYQKLCLSSMGLVRRVEWVFLVNNPHFDRKNIMSVFAGAPHSGFGSKPPRPKLSKLSIFYHFFLRLSSQLNTRVSNFTKITSKKYLRALTWRKTTYTVSYLLVLESRVSQKVALNKARPYLLSIFECFHTVFEENWPFL